MPLDPLYLSMVNDGVLKLSYIDLCQEKLGEYGGRAFLTPSCTSALELAVMLSGVGPGDEVILPSFTFSSGANAVIRAGGVPVFVDIRLDTLNIDLSDALMAITDRTRAMMPTHYAGVSPGIFTYGNPAGIKIIEDAAQAIGEFKLTGDFGCFSFHKTKNVQCGEGGALLIKDEQLIEKAQILRNCGTTLAFGKDWDWVGLGTHALMNEYTAEVLWRSLRNVESVNATRRRIWEIYRDGIKAEEKASVCANAHIFWFLTKNRDYIIQSLNSRGIGAVKHYTPLHNWLPGLTHGRAFGSCPNATYVAERILRLPMNVEENEAHRIVHEVNKELV